MARKKKIPTISLTPAGVAARITGARSVVLVAIVLTIVNLALLFAGKDQILFSVALSYYGVVAGLIQDNLAVVEDAALRVGPYTVAALILSAVLLVLLAVSFFRIKKSRSWTLAVMVGFIVDAVLLVPVSILMLNNPSYVVVDLCIHVWVVVLLAMGVYAWNQQALLDAEEKEQDVPGEDEA